MSNETTEYRDMSLASSVSNEADRRKPRMRWLSFSSCCKQLTLSIYSQRCACRLQPSTTRQR